MGIQIKQVVYEVLETGEYPAEVTEIALENGQFGEQLKFTFELENGHSLWGWASAKFSTKSKLYAWTQAILNQQISPTYVLDTDDLVGRKVKLVVVTEERDDGREFNKITRLKPFQQNGQAPVQRPVQPQREQPDPLYMGGPAF